MSTSLSSASAKSRDAVTIVIPRGPIGFEFSIKSNGPRIVISKVREGGTAELAGLKCGSILQAVNRQPIDGLSFLQVSNMIRRTSGLTTEISVIEPEECAAVDNVDGSFASGSTSSSRCNLDGVVLRNLHHNSSATSPNPSSSGPEIPPTHYRPFIWPTALLALELPSFLRGSTAESRQKGLFSASSDPRLQSRQESFLTSATDGNPVNSCGLRRQAILFSKDSTYVTEPSTRSSSSSSSSSSTYGEKTPEGNHMFQESSLDYMVSAFDSALKVVHRESSAPPAPSPQLVRRQAYPSSSSALSLSSSALARNRSVRTTPGTSEGPRFLPAHVSPTVPRVTPPQLTFLPKLTVRRKISSPILQTEKSSSFHTFCSPPSPSTSGKPRFTNLAAYMDELTTPIPQDHVPIGYVASVKSRLLGQHETSPSCLPLPTNSTLSLSDTDQTGFLKTTLTAGISSHSPLTSSPRTDVASPPPRKIKRKSLVPRIRCLDSEPTRSSACSSVTSMSFRKSLNAWRRRRPTRRDNDLHLAKNADHFRTAEASRLSRCRLLEGFANETLNAKSELYKSEECLCKVTKINGKILTPAIWSRFYVYIGNGFVRFRSASSDYHNSKKSTPGRFCLDDSSMVNDVDPPTPSSISSSDIVLPLQGLQWSNLRYLPSDLPTWGSSSSSSRRLNRLSSEMLEPEANAASDLQCYFFEHEDNGGSQIIVIFPNNRAAASALSVYQQFGGVRTENNPPDSSGLSYSLSLHTGLAAYHPSPDRGGGRGALRRTRKSLPDSAVRRRFAADFSHQEGKRARGKLNGGPLHGTKNSTTVTTTDRSVNTDDAVGVDGTSRFRFLSSAAAPFFKGIVNALSNSRAPPTLPTSAPPPPPSSPEELAHRIAAVIGEPPDLSDLNNPGPVFGAPLESQIPSPDYPNVPLILHALVMALELHGLHHVGLYRAPGRQKEINRFVCLANLTSLDPNVMLHLDTWRDIRALTGVIKIFFRRLPEPIFDPVLWGPLASIVPESPEEYDKVSLAYMLLAILPKLDKIRSAFVPLTSTNTSYQVNNTKYEKVMPTWLFATLDFLFGHLRRLVALEEANQCSFGCIAICFGPTLFRGDSPLQPKFNKLLEVMLQHWPWLVAETTNDLDDTDHSNSSRHPDLAQTEAYVEQFFDNGTDFGEESQFHFRPLETVKRAAYFSNDLTEDVLTAVEDIFTRAGMSVGSISRSESMKSINKNYDDDGSLLDIIMRSLSASSDFDDQKLAASPIFEGGHNAVIEQRRGCDKLDEASSSSPSMQRTDF
ncbi:unnamed protein product [Taenia asiatica]|uniref:PDZ domain-containing protein n=1 Tax=Taenia asiatica TaxID=60517 RepID=A0A0R3W7P2_TAEAS|nr:unnamed protein product [Taenia asiatica]